MSLARRVARRALDRAFTVRPFEPMAAEAEGVRCTVCGWRGDAFGGVLHCESAVCPRCGAIGRDRWLFHCLTTRVRLTRRTRLLETSPRLPEKYRAAMRRRLDYVCSDYDLRAHRADLALDLQAIDLPSASLDVVLTSHVLEHVPDTGAALRELHRVLRPGGSLLLLVPVHRGVTAPPREPEFHDDDTPVFWRFGLDLTDRLREHGFDANLLCTAEFARGGPWHDVAPEWDVPSILDAVDELTVVCDDDVARTAALTPGYMYLAWHAVRGLPSP